MAEAERIRIVRQAQAEGILAIRKAEAEGFKLIGEALPECEDEDLVVKRAGLVALQDVAQWLGDGKATKLFVPQNIGEIFSLVRGWKEAGGPVAQPDDKPDGTAEYLGAHCAARTAPRPVVAAGVPTVPRVHRVARKAGCAASLTGCLRRAGLR